ncbi:MAG: MFS transporter [Anaerolineaceae bacterium]|nr:MFS transporter [Anaerolineaceae bacterium]
MQGKSKIFKYTMFGLLYFSQGTILSYFTALNALYLLENGLSMSDVGILGTIAMIPFILKIFLGFLSDKVNLFGKGHRKPYILIGLFIQILFLLIVPGINPRTNFPLFIAAAFMVQLGMALYDTCTDGLALDTIPEEEQGTIQTFMVGGRAVGLIATATLVGLLAENVSWTAVFIALAAFTLLPVPFVLQVKDGERSAENQFDWKAFKAFKKTSVLSIAGMGFIIFFIIVGINQIINPFMQDKFGITLAQAGTLTTVWGIGILLGSIFGGKIYDAIGKRKALIIGIGLSIFSLLGLAFTPQLWLAWVFMFIFGFSYGTYQTIYFALAMNITNAAIAASMFSILMSVTNIGQAVGMGISGSAVDKIGYPLVFILFAALNLLLIPLLKPAFNEKGN